MGIAKIQKYSHSLIHYYDLNPIILEINKLKLQSENLRVLVDKNPDYSNDSSNYLKILTLTQDKVEEKLVEIIPHPKRYKRGLINGLGSIFRAISGNLDAYDGERYDKLIEKLQNNQDALVQNFEKQSSLSLSLIDKFNSTICQVRHNEKLIEAKINQIALFVTKSTYRENSMFIKDILNQIINMFEIISSILQDIENSITFARLQVMHPSIISTTHLYKELKRLQKITGNDQLPVEITFNNTLLYRNIIKIQGYIKNNKITYILKIPIVHPYSFEYFHLFSIPIKRSSQFKAIIPRKKYLANNELYYVYMSESCTIVHSQFYICDQLDLQESKIENPCEIQIMSMKNTSNCQQTALRITKSTFKRLDESYQWIGILPHEEKIKLRCQQQEEIQKLIGTFMFEIPLGCHLSTNQENITNDKSENQNQPILFPNLETAYTTTTDVDLTLHLDYVELDELQEIKNQVIHNQLQLSSEGISRLPSVWTIIIYGLILIILLHFGHSKIKTKCTKTATTSPQVTLSEVQIPR